MKLLQFIRKMFNRLTSPEHFSLVNGPLCKKEKLSNDEIKEINAKLETHPTGWYTIAGYASKIGMNLNIRTAGCLGMKASQLSRQLGREIQKTPDPRFGMVNVYCPEVLEEVFSENGFSQ